MPTMDRDSLLERLRGIEWDDFEVKAAQGGVPQTAYTTVSAFANTAGGWLVFGVEEARKGFHVLGVADPDSLQNDFLGTCRSTQKFSRPVEARPHHFVIDEHSVLAFYIAPARRFDKPVRVRVKKAWETYIRVGARDEKCSAEQEARFLRDASVETFDTLTLPSATVAALDGDTLRWTRAIYAERHPARPLSELSDRDFLDELGLIRDGMLTHAAALLFGSQKLISAIEPAGILDFRLVRQRWSQESPAHRFDDRFLSELNVLETLRALIGRFLQLVPNPFAIDPTTMQRQAHPPEYPALREALVNLLVHQDYSDTHRTARILWYSDRTIFDNPGDSFVSLAEMLDGGASDLRNPRLARLMRQIGFAEQAGTGIPAIVRTWRDVGRVPPTIDNDPGRKTYQLVLGWDVIVKREDRFWKEKIGASVSPGEARILQWLQRVGVADRLHARFATGEPARKTWEMVDHLLVNCLVERADDGDQIRLSESIQQLLDGMDGGPVGATPEVTPEVAPEVAPEVTPEVMRLLAALDGEMGRKELQSALGLKDEKHFRQRYQQPAMVQGLIEMTIPDKPRSSRQRYRLTETGRALVAETRGASS
jgi:ATP-dependent DNA helicase RecG